MNHDSTLDYINDRIMQHGNTCLWLDTHDKPGGDEDYHDIGDPHSDSVVHGLLEKGVPKGSMIWCEHVLHMFDDGGPLIQFILVKPNCHSTASTLYGNLTADRQISPIDDLKAHLDIVEQHRDWFYIVTNGII